MVTLQLREEVCQKLQQIADSRQQTVEEMMEDFASQQAISDIEEYVAARMTQTAREANIQTGVKDMARRSREILENEFGQYVAERLVRPAENPTNDASG
jgi:predicted transcriptional regulator